MYKAIMSILTRLFLAFMIAALVIAAPWRWADVSAHPDWSAPRLLTTFTTDVNVHIGLSALATSGNLAYFLKDTQVNQGNSESCNLWVSDGSSSGSRDIMEVVFNTNMASCSFAAGMETMPFGAHSLLFNTYNYTGAPQAFYATDGVSSEKLLDGPAQHFIRINGQVFFLYYDFSNGLALWTTDGTPQGTQLIKKVPGSGVSAFWDGYKMLMLLSFDDGSSWLWKTDGTAQGTVAVSQITSQNYYKVSNWTIYKDKAYFMVQSLASSSPFTAPWSLWVSDGSQAGTSRVDNLPYGNAVPRFFAGTDNFLFFIMGDQTNYPSEVDTLWQSDGTAASTQTVSDTPLASLDAVAAYKDAVYWYSYADGAFEKSTGRTGGITKLLTGSPSNSMNILFLQNDFLYLASVHAWETDGKSLTELAGTQDYSHPVNLTGFRGQLFFTLWVGDSATGFELWKSDGTPKGTGLYADLVPGPDSSFPDIAGVAGERLYFLTRDSTNGTRLWVVDDPLTSRVYFPAIRR